MSFADLEMAGILEKTRTQRYLGEINQVIDWAPIEELLRKDYPVGHSSLGNKAYQPLVLMITPMEAKPDRVNGATPGSP
jgi:hypothetical protein